MNNILNYKFMNNTFYEWIIALIIALAFIIILRLIQRVMVHYFSKISEKSPKDIYEVLAILVKGINKFLIFIFGLYFASVVLNISPRFLPWISSITIAAFILQLSIWANAMVKFTLERYQKVNLEIDSGKVTTMRAIGFSAKLLIGAIALLLILDNIPGVEITTLIAGLGVGGIAVALAVQNILSDLFASFSIIFDKPFVIGDFIIVDSYLGSVEYIGLKTTRIRSLSGEQLVFSNNDLLSSRIRNYKLMEERRVVFSIGVVYATPYEKLKKIPEWIKAIVEQQVPARYDRAHFQSFGDYDLKFEIVYYVLSPDYSLYMDIQQAINLALYQKFEFEGIDFAFPTQTINLRDSASKEGTEE